MMKMIQDMEPWAQTLVLCVLSCVLGIGLALGVVMMSRRSSSGGSNSSSSGNRRASQRATQNASRDKDKLSQSTRSSTGTVSSDDEDAPGHAGVERVRAGGLAPVKDSHSVVSPRAVSHVRRRKHTSPGTHTKRSIAVTHASDTKAEHPSGIVVSTDEKLVIDSQLVILENPDADTDDVLRTLRELHWAVDQCLQPEMRGVNKSAEFCNAVMNRHAGLDLIKFWSLPENTVDEGVRTLAHQLIEKMVPLIWG